MSSEVDDSNSPKNEENQEESLSEIDSQMDAVVKEVVIEGYENDSSPEVLPDSNNTALSENEEVGNMMDVSFLSTESLAKLEENTDPIDSEPDASKEEENTNDSFLTSQRDDSNEIEKSETLHDDNGQVDQADENQAGSPDVLEHDTEMVSEDELPVDSKEVPDTEEVSDEELPGNAIENLETEAISEDELPPVSKKKRKHDTEDSDKVAPKKKNKKDKEKTRQKKSSSEEPEEPDKANDPGKPLHPSTKSKSLPELEKYWKVVNEDPTDFTGWTYLLQYVDQESDVEAAREAYDNFLGLYPYCYGYWRKYADYEKRKGDKSRCAEVFLKGLKAIPLSVDLWLHYLNFVKVNHKENETFIREEFERAIDTCGLDFRSDRLWDCYVKWETEGKRLHNVYLLYDRLLRTPTHGYKGHFENFEDFVKNNQPSKILTVDDFLNLRSEVVQKLRQKPVKETNAPPSAAPPGDEEEDDEEPSPGHADEETTLIREKIIANKKKIFKDTVTAVLARWNFEEGIKRPYFHVKPLERCQLNTWREYLDFEIADGDEVRAIILFERCLIACALYEEFWVKFIKYLESLPKDMTEKIREVYQRACCIHHPKKPFLSLNWATFEEIQGDFDQVRQILNKVEELVPNLLHVITRQINLERRCGNIDGVSSLYEKYLSTTKSKSNFIVLSTKYARFCAKILKNPTKGIEVMRKAVERDQENPRIYSQLLELTMMKDPLDETECLEIFNEVIEKDSMDLEYKRIFSQRKIEFLEDFGTIQNLQKAQVEYGNILKQLKEKKKKYELDKLKMDDKTKGKDGSTVSSVQSAQSPYSVNSNYNQTGGAYGVQGSYQGGSGQYSQQSSYNQQPFLQYNQGDQNWGYSQTGYGNYNQNWGGYNYYS